VRGYLPSAGYHDRVRGTRRWIEANDEIRYVTLLTYPIDRSLRLSIGNALVSSDPDLGQR
jgi:hypothetical protein